MSKIVYICLRDPYSGLFSTKDLNVISDRITPDNITARQPEIYEERGVMYSIMSPTALNEKVGPSVILGKASTDSTDWWKPGSVVPDGSYSLFRADDNTVEIITDVVSSRSVWYYLDSEMFIASSSQRALVMLMKSFEFNVGVLPWVLSTGSLGPANSWDNRIKFVEPDSKVVLDRHQWLLKIETKAIKFLTQEMSAQEHQKELKEALKETFSTLNLKYDSWALLLSGGYDSRAILSFLHSLNNGIGRLKTITWGLANALTEKGSDAFIAKKLADHFQVRHEYYHTDLGDEPVEKILNRYLVCGEGRIDHLGGYMDGFKIWKTLYENQVQGIIRGDECLGGRLVDTPLNVRSRIGISLCSDYSNLKNYHELGIPEHNIPKELQQVEGETLEQWRDRIYNQYRMPVILAALNDLKLPYVEIANPFLSRRIIYKVRELPDKLRTRKMLFKKIADEMSPDIEYANSSAIQSKINLVKSKSIAELTRSELNSESASQIFPEAFIRYITSNLDRKQTARKPTASLKGILASFMPRWMRIGAKSVASKPFIDFHILAFRMYLAIKMSQVLREDVKALKNMRATDNAISSE